MAIPPLNSNGLLPGGIHDATLDEIRERFGSFQQSDRRPKLYARLTELVAELRRSGLFVAVVVNGSFVTANATPNDIDLLLVLSAGHDFHRDPLPDHYNVLSRRKLRQRFGFDVFVGADGDVTCEGIVEFFGRVRDNPDVRKGMLRIDL